MAQAVITIECGLTSGLGRVRRSLTLAAALEKQGFDITVVLSSDKGMSLVNSLGFSAQLEMPVDLSEALVVIDTCSQTPEEIGEICRASKASLVIDDLAERPIACDYLVNPNLYAKELDYSAYSVGQLFLGPDYALIDQRFFDLAKPKEERSGVVVSFGGTDGGTLALPILKDLLAGSDEPVYLPVPDYIELDSAVKLLAATNEALEVVRNADMPELLGKSRAYIGSAGATTLEAIAAGCAISVTATQKDQHRNTRWLENKGFSTPTNMPNWQKLCRLKTENPTRLDLHVLDRHGLESLAFCTKSQFGI